MLMMISNIQFRNGSKTFQIQLNEDIKQIKRDSKIFVPADKSCKLLKNFKHNKYFPGERLHESNNH